MDARDLIGAERRKPAHPFANRIGALDGGWLDSSTSPPTTLEFWHASESPPAFAPSSSLQLVRRPIVGLVPGFHFGVRVGGEVLDEAGDRVVDFQSTGAVRCVSWETFRASLQVVPLDIVVPEGRSLAHERLRLVLAGKFPYSPTKQNCEHVARFIITGEATSAQGALLALLEVWVGLWVLGKVLDA